MNNFEFSKDDKDLKVRRILGYAFPFLDPGVSKKNIYGGGHTFDVEERTRSSGRTTRYFLGYGNYFVPTPELMLPDFGLDLMDPATAEIFKRQLVIPPMPVVVVER